MKPTETDRMKATEVTLAVTASDVRKMLKAVKKCNQDLDVDKNTTVFFTYRLDYIMRDGQYLINQYDVTKVR